MDLSGESRDELHISFQAGGRNGLLFIEMVKTDG